MNTEREEIACRGLDAGGEPARRRPSLMSGPVWRFFRMEPDAVRRSPSCDVRSPSLLPSLSMGFLVAAWFLVACAQQSAPASPPPAPAPAGEPPQRRVILPDGFAVSVEIAADQETRAQGLMYRDRLDDSRGMLFFFPRPGMYPFWMKNTLIPLDMIWLDSQHRVVSVLANVPPCKADPCPSHGGDREASYVLETAPGVAARHGVVPGATLRFEGLDGVIAR